MATGVVGGLVAVVVVVEQREEVAREGERAASGLCASLALGHHLLTTGVKGGDSRDGTYCCRGAGRTGWGLCLVSYICHGAGAQASVRTVVLVLGDGADDLIHDETKSRV